MTSSRGRRPRSSTAACIPRHRDPWSCCGRRTDGMENAGGNSPAPAKISAMLSMTARGESRCTSSAVPATPRHRACITAKDAVGRRWQPRRGAGDRTRADRAGTARQSRPEGGLASNKPGSAQQSGIEITFSRHGELPHRIGATESLCLYRVAQEALHNVVTHSKTARAWVQLSSVRGELGLIVGDSGQGRAPRKDHSPVTPPSGRRPGISYMPVP